MIVSFCLTNNQSNGFWQLLFLQTLLKGFNVKLNESVCLCQIWNFLRLIKTMELSHFTDERMWRNKEIEGGLIRGNTAL